MTGRENHDVSVHKHSERFLLLEYHFQVIGILDRFSSVGVQSAFLQQLGPLVRQTYCMDGTAVVLESTPAIEEITEAERKAGFDYTSRYYLDMSGDEFLRRLDNRELPDNDPLVDKLLDRLWLVRPQYHEG